jgi:hypothetical protein
VLRLICKLDSFLLNHILESGIKTVFQVRLSISVSRVDVGGSLGKKQIVVSGHNVLRNFIRVGARKYDID